MTTIRDRIVDYLSRHPEGADDDELAIALNLRHRQQANSRCRQLAQEGRIERKIIGGKIRNFSTNSNVLDHSRSPKMNVTASEPWYWEGNVQASVKEFLRKEGYEIIRFADTRGRQQNAAVTLGIAFPDFPRYKKLAERVAWLQPVVRFSFLWVGENGTVDATELLGK